VFLCIVVDAEGADVIGGAVLRCQLCGIHSRLYRPMCCHCSGYWASGSRRRSDSLHLDASQHRLGTDEVKTRVVYWVISSRHRSDSNIVSPDISFLKYRFSYGEDDWSSY